MKGVDVLAFTNFIQLNKLTYFLPNRNKTVTFLLVMVSRLICLNIIIEIQGDDERDSIQSIQMSAS